MSDERPKISSITHPEYNANLVFWTKYRDTYVAGHKFADKYLTQFSGRETAAEFLARRKMAYTPAHSKAAVNEIKNAIYQRTADITRLGGSSSYQDAVTNKDIRGVDLKGRDMGTFIGTKILPELLSIGKVGVLVDMPVLQGETLIDVADKRPYLYMYEAEDIRSWVFDSETQKLTSLLLREYYFEYDPLYDLPTEKKIRYRLIRVINDLVTFVIYDEKGEEDKKGALEIPEIPFVLFEISSSLLTDVADYQIALLNLGSSDITYAIKSNFPFYTEQQDMKSASPWTKGAAPPDEENDGEAADTKTNNNPEIAVGSTTGRAYGKDLDRPGFIHPSGEPLRISMEKQKELREEIRSLVNLSVQSLTPTKMQSADSKSMDERSLEAGLSYIGLTLLLGEQNITKFWAMFEGSKEATIKYPKHYSLRTTESELDEAKDLIDLQSKAPSDVYRKELSKRVARLLLSRHISSDKLTDIEKEIDSAEVTLVDPDILLQLNEVGGIDLKRIAKALGVPEVAVKDAAIEHAARLARISKAQSDPKDRTRGVADTDPEPGKSDKDEKKESQKPRDDEENPKKKVRS